MLLETLNRPSHISQVTGQWTQFYVEVVVLAILQDVQEIVEYTTAMPRPYLDTSTSGADITLRTATVTRSTQ
jgi:hypothetical protein